MPPTRGKPANYPGLLIPTGSASPNAYSRCYPNPRWHLLIRKSPGSYHRPFCVNQRRPTAVGRAGGLSPLLVGGRGYGGNPNLSGTNSLVSTGSNGGAFGTPQSSTSQPGQCVTAMASKPCALVRLAHHQPRSVCRASPHDPSMRSGIWMQSLIDSPQWDSGGNTFCQQPFWHYMTPNKGSGSWRSDNRTWRLGHSLASCSMRYSVPAKTAPHKAQKSKFGMCNVMWGRRP